MAPSKKKITPKPKPATAYIDVPDEVIKEIAEKILARPPAADPPPRLTAEEIRLRVRLGQWRWS